MSPGNLARLSVFVDGFELKMLEGQWETIWKWLQMHQNLLGWAALASLIMFLGTLVAVPLLVIALPHNYLIEQDMGLLRIPRLWRWPYLLIKNGIGAGLVLAGAAMLVLPGQGLLTLVIGLSLMNFPGKRRLIIRILSRPRVFRTINSLRDKARRPPLQWPLDDS
jgi:hypothetical protein